MLGNFLYGLQHFTHGEPQSLGGFKASPANAGVDERGRVHHLQVLRLFAASITNSVLDYLGIGHASFVISKILQNLSFWPARFDHP